MKMWVVAALVFWAAACSSGAYERSGSPVPEKAGDFTVRLYYERPPVTPFKRIGKVTAKGPSEVDAKLEFVQQARYLGAEAVIDVVKSKSGGDYQFEGEGIIYENQP